MRLTFFIVGFIFKQLFFIIRNYILFGADAVLVYIFSQYLVSKKVLIAKYNIIYNILSVLFVESLINIFINNLFFTMLITNLLFYVLSIAFYYLHKFRGNSLYFADIFCISTAKEVASGYEYNIEPQFVIIFILNIISLCVFRFSIGFANNVFIVFRIMIAVFIYFVIRVICSQYSFNYSLNAGDVDGYIYNFISSCPVFYINKKEQVFKINLDGSMAQPEEQNSPLDNSVNCSLESVGQNSPVDNSENRKPAKDAPHVIVIMNESFSHINERLNTNIPVTPVYDNLKGVLKGNLLVNTFGGGTETTEFEFLTSMHVGSNPYPIYPYNQIKTEKWSMARFFNNNDYRTIAMHPYTATNYHRNVIYKLFGFKELFFYDEFKHKETIRNYVSDEAMYSEIIDKYEETKQNNKKMFSFGITMQNHSGYRTFDGQEIEVNEYIEDKISINSYLSLLHISDKSIKKLIDYFDKENERVLICFFGDHNASFSPIMNKNIYDITNNYEGKNVYETPFFIYDNKNKKEEGIKQISTNFLGIELLKRTGLILPDYYKMLDEIYDRVHYMNFHREKNREDNLLYYINDLEKEYIKYRNGFL